MNELGARRAAVGDGYHDITYLRVEEDEAEVGESRFDRQRHHEDCDGSRDQRDNIHTRRYVDEKYLRADACEDH